MLAGFFNFWGGLALWRLRTAKKAAQGPDFDCGCMLISLRMGMALFLTLFLCAFALPLAAGAQANAAESALVEAARLAARTDRNRESADLFEQAILAQPDRRRDLLPEYADQLLYSGRSAQAVLLYTEALKAPASRDERLRLLKGLGLALLWTDRPGRAREVFEAVVREQPNDHDARRNLGRAMSWSGRQREAVDHFQLLLREHPQDQEARVQLAQAQAWLGLPDEAAQTLTQVTEPREDARKLREELQRSAAPRTVVDAQSASQSDRLNMRALRLGHAISFAEGRGSVGVRIDRLDYERDDGSDSARVTRPMMHARYRFNRSLEINGEAGREHIQPTGSPAMEPTVYATWLTWWPSDLFRFDFSANQGTFDNLQSLRLGLTSAQRGVSVDFTPSERERYTLRLERGHYSDGNSRGWGQAEVEYRWSSQPQAWIGLRHTRFEFERQLNNGYFNPLTFESTQVTLRTLWLPDGAGGRWDVAGYLALGRENAVPDGRKPAYDVSLRAGWKLDRQTRIEGRAQRFSSRTTSAGFARTIVGINLDRSW